MSESEKKVREEYRKLTKLLIERQLTITTMESATSGQIASLITDTEGASAIMKGAMITYSNEAKIMAGVPEETIEKFSVYSLETARDMAKVCRRTFAANIGIGVTGTMGNIDPANADDSCPGNVYFAIDFNGVIYSFHVELPVKDNRLQYKLAVAQVVVDQLLQII